MKPSASLKRKKRRSIIKEDNSLFRLDEPKEALKRDENEDA
jgi:hypothetical protein